MFQNTLERKTSFGLLVMRVGLATVLLLHTVPKLFGGTAAWKGVGTSLSYISFGLPVEIFGFCVLLVEALAGLSLLCGYLFRTFCILLTVLYGLFCFNYFNMKGYITLTLFSLALAFVFLGLLNTGPGRYAVAVKLEKK